MIGDMEDNLKKFVKNHKNDFDTLTPQDKIWEGIHKELDSSIKTTNKLIIWRAAAIILFIFSIGLTFYANRDSILKNKSQIVYDEEFLTTEKYYTSVIHEREQLVEMVAATYPEVKNDFELDWKTLDKSYSNLKDEYSKNQSREVLDALVQNLRSRVDLLNKQIEILESIESENKNILEI
jgi:hypothetical protein